MTGRGFFAGQVPVDALCVCVCVVPRLRGLVAEPIELRWTKRLMGILLFFPFASYGGTIP